MMQHNATKHRRGWSRHVMGALGALVIAASALALTASAASATMACNYPEGSNTCLTIEPLGNRWYSVQVGIDVYMDPQEAQDLIIWARSCWPQPCSLFSAWLYGEDEGGDPGLFPVGVSSGTAWEGGLAAEFYIEVPSRDLDEDPCWFGLCRDELYAAVVMTDYRTGHSQRFTSGRVVGYWGN